MMIKKRYCLWLLLVTGSIIYLEISIASVHEGKTEVKSKEELWKPAEAPKTREEARRLEQEATQQEEAAKEKLKEIKDPEEIARQKANLAKALFDYDIADRALTQYEILEDPRQSSEFKKLAQENLAELREEIQKKINAYSQALASEGVTIGQPVIEKPTEGPAKTYDDQLRGFRVDLGEQVFQDAYKTPEEQIEALNKIQETIRKNGIDDAIISQRLAARLTSPEIINYRLSKAQLPEGKNSIIQEALTKLRVNSLRNAESYPRELSVLDQLTKTVDALGPQFKIVSEAMKQRQQEIKKFLSESKKPSQETTLGQELNLAAKIPSDQILVLGDVLSKAMGEFQKGARSNKDLALKKVNEILNDIKTTMETYKLTDGYYKEFYNKINNYADAYKPVEQKVPTSPKEERGAVLQFVHDTLDAMQAGVDKATVAQKDIVDSVGATLQTVGEKVGDYGNMLATVPESAQNATDLAHAVNENTTVQRFKEGGLTRKAIELVAGADTVNALDRTLKSVKNTEQLLKDPTTKQITNNVGFLGNALRTVGSAVKSAGEFVIDLNTTAQNEIASFNADPSKQREEKEAVLEQIAAAREQIEEARSQIQPDADAVPQKLRDKIKTFFNDLVTSIKNVFVKPKGIQERLADTSKKYETARQEYRDFLGVTPDASFEVIQKAIDAKKSDPKQSFLEKTMLNAAQDYAKVVRDYADTLKGVQSSIDVALKAGDYLLVPDDINENLLKEKGKLAENVNAFFGIKKAQLNYLDAVRQESENALSQIKELTAKTPVNTVTKEMSDSISHLIEGNLLRNLGDVANNTTVLENELATQRKELLKKMPQQQASGAQRSGMPVEEGGYD